MQILIGALRGAALRALRLHLNDGYRRTRQAVQGRLGPLA